MFIAVPPEVTKHGAAGVRRLRASARIVTFTKRAVKTGRGENRGCYLSFEEILKARNGSVMFKGIAIEPS